MISPYYINLQGKYGNRMEEYIGLVDLLSHMDRLGIWQTTATCIRTNARESNLCLLEDLKNTPGAKGRVIPAFLAEPHIYVSKGEMEHLEMCLRDCGPACIRLIPTKGGYRLKEMEQVLLRLEEYQPIILIDRKDMDTDANYDDLVFLAQRFPCLKFVVQRVFWSRMHYVFDAMQRAGNIYIDTGWLHTERGTEMLCEQFSPERVLFSLGLRSNNGAAIAGLCYADLSQKIKDAIAWDNFAALFDEKNQEILRTNRHSIPNKVANSYWNRYLEEKPIGTRIIDSHAHISPHIAGWFAPNNDIVEATPLFYQKMERLGMEKAIVSQPAAVYEDPRQPNTHLLECTREYADKISGYLSYIPFGSDLYTKEYMDKMFATGFFIGFKTMPGYNGIGLGDERYIPMFEYAKKHALPILLHTWGAKDIRSFAEVSARWPGVKIILGHSGGLEDGRQECHKVAQDPKYPDLYFEFCGSFFSTVSWKDSLKFIDYRRVLFGTDANLHDAAWELGRLLSEDIPDEQLDAILSGNAVNLFGLK
ncbi:MAG: amidohydrolase family protein [Oscillospiraceae bacterium]|nr:amidohydrolase family protein [Oscillospiraceae bacterium]